MALRIGRRFGGVDRRQPYEGGRGGKIVARCWAFCEVSQSCAWAPDGSLTCGGPGMGLVARRGARGRRKAEEGRPAASLTEACCCNVGIDATGIRNGEILQTQEDYSQEN
jgi:hypothetical protein